MSRPTKYTKIKADKIVEGLRAGMTRTAASALVEIPASTLFRWCNRYASFATRVELAEQEAEARYIGVIAKSAFGHDVTERKEIHKANGDVETTITTKREYDWQAARYWLSRRRREDWGDRVDITLHNEIDSLLTDLARLTSSEPSEESLTVH